MLAARKTIALDAPFLLILPPWEFLQKNFWQKFFWQKFFWLMEEKHLVARPMVVNGNPARQFQSAPQSDSDGKASNNESDSR
jgi:hypothetical protein